MLFKYLIILYQLILTISLQNHNPNPNYRKYIPNINPDNDLYKISSSQASVISKEWLENIIIDTFSNHNKKGSVLRLSNKLLEIEDAHIVSSINQLEDYITNHRQETDIYLAWMPISIKKIKTPIFLIIAEIDNINKLFIIKQLVQSPFWEPEQIDSNQLKIALTNYKIKFNCTGIDLNYLYEHDLRYKLAWATWHLEINNQ